MKSTIIRIIAAIMALVMVASCFAGCEKKTEEPGVTKPQSVEGPANDDVNVDDSTTTSTTTTTKPSTSTTTTTKPSTSTTTTTSSSGSSGGTLSQADMNAALNAAGYAYDANQQIYYSTMNPWQRHFGFGEEYDQAAVFANMRYTTLKADFDYDGLKWRLQWWKGQYGVLVGAELGVYTKDPNDNSTTYYECASQEHLLEMSMDFYMTAKDYRSGNRLFYREEQAHWWLTGFKFGYADSRKLVVVATLKAFDHEMANAIEKSFEKLTGSAAGRQKFKYMTELDGQTTDCYTRKGDTFTVVWEKAGFENYS